MYQYELTITTDEPLGQFFENTLEVWLESPMVQNDQTPNSVNVEMEKQQ